jgi:excisionase family DNA binding protein
MVYDNISDVHRPERRRQRRNVVPHSETVMLSVREIARRYGFHENTVRRWVSDGDIRFIRYGPGGKIFIAEEAVENFIRQYYY